VRIEWLNESRTRARLIKGWLRKKEAIVERRTWWYFEGTEHKVAFWRDSWLDYAMQRPHWTPVRRLPEARLIERR